MRKINSKVDRVCKNKIFWCRGLSQLSSLFVTDLHLLYNQIDKKSPVYWFLQMKENRQVESLYLSQHKQKITSIILWPRSLLIFGKYNKATELIIFIDLSFSFRVFSRVKRYSWLVLPGATFSSSFLPFSQLESPDLCSFSTLFSSSWTS